MKTPPSTEPVSRPHDDDDRQFQIRLLRWVAWATLVALGIFAAANAAIGQFSLTYTRAGIPLIGCGVLGAFVLLRLGRLEAAAHVYLWLLFAGITMSCLDGGGVRSPAMFSYVGPLAVAWRMLGTREFTAVAAATGAAIVGLGILGDLQLLPGDRTAGFPAWRWALTPAMTILVAGIGLYWVGRDHAQRLANLRRARDELERNVAALTASEQRLSLALEVTRLASFDWNVATGEVALSARWNEILGGDPAPIVVSFAALAERTHPEDRARLHPVVVAALKGEHEPYWVEHRVRRHDGEWIWIQSHGRVVARDAAGRALRLVGTNADISRRKRDEATMERVARGISPRIGRDYFRGVVEFLAAELPADMVFVAELVGGGERVRTLACCSDGRIVENFEYALRGTPCERAFDGPRMVLHPERVTDLFPEAEVLGPLGMDGYACIAVTDAAGSPLGLLVALARQPISRGHYFQSLLELAAGRVAAELERARNERALRESEEQYQALFAQPAVGVALSGLDLRFLQVNDKLCEMIGYSRAELLRMNVRDVNFPEGVTDLVEHRRRLVAGEVHGTVRVKTLRRKDGAALWVSMVVHVVRDAAGEAQRYIAVIQEVTEQKRAEDALAAQRAFLRQVIDLDRNFIFAKDRAGRFILSNRAVAEAYGTTVETITGRTDADFNPNRDEVEHFRRDDLEVMDTGREKIIAEERLTDAAGAVRWLQTVKRPIRGADGATDMVLGVATDITERKRAEEALAEERNLLRAVIDNLPELVFVKDLAHRLVLANTAWIDLRAGGNAGIIGRRLSDVFTPEAAAASEEEDRQVFRSGRPSREREIELANARGERRCYVVHKTPLRDAAGGIIGLVGISRDITEDKQHVEDLARFTAGLEARVRERTAQLERANRELEAFTFSVSHDLRAPLRAIDGFSERVLIESAGRLSPKAEGYVKRVRLASQRMARLIDNLLELSQTGRREPRRRFVDVSAMASEIGAELREVEPDRQVALTVQPGIAAVADGELLRIVLDNLLRNAWKFTSGRDRGEVEVGWERREGRMVYFVRDNGAGFDMRRAGRLFAPFQRLHRASEFPGTGIGLAVAQRVVRRHLGEIWAQAEVDQGATFYFTLDAGTAPGIPAEAAGAAAAPAPAPAQPGEPGREPAAGEITADDLPAVLVVDDDEAVLEILREELGRDGHLILTAPDGATGLEILARSNVGVVVSDYSMPGMTGTEFLGAVRERHPGVVRILFTSRPDARVLSEAVNEGGVSYLVEKDWDRLYLRARVRDSVIAAARRA